MPNESLNDIEEVSPQPELLDLTSGNLTIPTPDNPPWNSAFAFILWIASVLLILFLPLLFVLPYAVRQNIEFGDSQALTEFLKNDQFAVLLNLLAILPAHFLTLLLAWLIVTRYREFPFRQTLGWEWGGFKFWHGVVFLVGFFIVILVVGNYFPEQDNDLLQILKSSRTAVYLVAFIATFTAPLVEEVVYRGVLYSAFQKTVGVPAAFLFVTSLFALVHVPQYYPSYSTIFLILLLSLVLTLVRVWTKNLLPCIVLHFLFNGFQSILLVAEPYLQKYFEQYQQNLQENAASIISFLK